MTPLRQSGSPLAATPSRFGMFRLAITWLMLVLLAPANAISDAVIAELVESRLVQFNVPSASVAIVADGRITHHSAYGFARVGSAKASSSTRYQIGSISKQFVAVALLLLQEDGKLKLDSPVADYLPAPGAARNVSVRQLLSHTSGLRDYAPQDYLPASMLEPIEATEIVRRWAVAEPDFAAGSDFQYSNTGYVMAGLLIEKLSGMPLFEFMKRRIFEPLGMKSVIDIDTHAPQADDAQGYTRIALAPLQLASKAGKGWFFGAGQLAMTAQDLARWNLSHLEQSLLQPKSYLELMRENQLTSGVGTQYALGLRVKLERGRRLLFHGGATSGFVAFNLLFPDQGIAVSVLTNSDAAQASRPIAKALAEKFLEERDPTDTVRLTQSREILEALQRGQIDRAKLSAHANHYFTDEAVRLTAQALKPLGQLRSMVRTDSGRRGGMDFVFYLAKYDSRELEVLTRVLPDGLLEQFIVGLQ